MTDTALTPSQRKKQRYAANKAARARQSLTDRLHNAQRKAWAYEQALAMVETHISAGTKFPPSVNLDEAREYGLKAVAEAQAAVAALVAELAEASRTTDLVVEPAIAVDPETLEAYERFEKQMAQRTREAAGLAH